jgi:hypothetical protein
MEKNNPKKGPVKASDCQCCVCGKPAVAFWPVNIDPDIPSQPYCRKCLDAAKVRVLVDSFGYEQKAAEAFVKHYHKEHV